MSWFTPAKGLSEKAGKTLQSMVDMHDAQASCVAEFLNDVAADNMSEGDVPDDEFLIACALEIKEAAQFFINGVKGGGKE